MPSTQRTDVNGSTPLLQPTDNGDRYELTSPTAMPKAGAFLWNQKMMIQLTCRGYATAQHMQPEPAKYAHAPNVEAKTFMQPEQNYYTHHPGRFVYVKDEANGKLFSAPYEPVRAPLDKFVFSAGKSDINWTVEYNNVRVEMTVGLPVQDVAELWTVKVTNLAKESRKLSVTPYFPVGYMSWMNQGAEWRSDFGGVVASSITPYQKAAEYFKSIKFSKDKTYFLCDTKPDSWTTNHDFFEGEGGLHNPSGIQAASLGGEDARYETPTAAVQYKVSLSANASTTYRFLFGPAFDDAEIIKMRKTYLSEAAFSSSASDYAAYMLKGAGCLHIETPDAELDNFVNHWLPRQCFYHGDVNRLSTDPQTRNYMQDNMGMAFINPAVARKAIVTAVGQQEKNGSMPDGILLAEGAELKYINQVPHTDHCVWLPVALEIYLSETGDYELLDEVVPGMHGDSYTVFERFSRAMDWLEGDSARDHRGLSLIAQGDWCDPMNMVGYKGKGVSGWLTVATAYALKLWASICADFGRDADAKRYRSAAEEVNKCANKYFWDGEWFARGITDDNVTFGTKADKEGMIWLNPQAWSILGGAASAEQRAKILPAVDKHLSTPYGTLMFYPAFMGMREDVGRVTQKFPGQGENGSVYNHAAAFYVWALYTLGGEEKDRAFEVMRRMVPGPSAEDYVQRGQLPLYIPNYYRGGYTLYPKTAGRSSQLFNTGTTSWVYRSLVDGLCGLRGERKGMRVCPQLPKSWDGMKARRDFRGATFDVEIKRGNVKEVQVKQDGKAVENAFVTNFETGRTYKLEVVIPK